MTDPTEITEAIARVEDAFDHGHREPEFEPKIDPATDANESAVVLQKGCRNLEAAADRLLDAEFYTSVIEHSFSGIERTIGGVSGDRRGERPRGTSGPLDALRPSKGTGPDRTGDDRGGRGILPCQQDDVLLRNVRCNTIPGRIPS